ncbi:hypothetical protein O3P69_001150 [Scylla paramamosain]|uniref:Uncharacterized protein n=1 Tax=Scylla paramamosain TaxID=85552 RepID=A0AAW0US66_SCYPA
MEQEEEEEDEEVGVPVVLMGSPECQLPSSRPQEPKHCLTKPHYSGRRLRWRVRGSVEGGRRGRPRLPAPHTTPLSPALLGYHAEERTEGRRGLQQGRRHLQGLFAPPD